MRGLFFRNPGSLDNLQVAELPMPVSKAGEVLVQVLAAAINPSDAKNVLGKMAEAKTPRVPGRDFGLHKTARFKWLFPDRGSGQPFGYAIFRGSTRRSKSSADR